MTFTNNLVEQIAASSSKAAIVYDGQEISYSELRSYIQNFAHILAVKGLPFGSRVAIQNYQAMDLLIGYYACHQIGLVPMPLPFVDQERIDGAVDAGNVQSLVSNVFDQAKATKIDARELPKAEPAEEALILFTSGTTSKKLKGVRLSHRGIANICAFMNRSMGTNLSTKECVFAALDHAFGFGRVHSILSAGGTVILPSSMKRISFIEQAVDVFGCNALSTPPSVLSSLLQMPHQLTEKMRQNIKTVQTGAMRFDGLFRKQLLDTLPKANIFLHYGLSEAMRVTFFDLRAHSDKLHTEGCPSEGTELAILGEDLKPLPVGEEGLIAIRGDNRCLGYLDNDLWQSCLHDDWFVTSDIGKLDDDGFLEFKGRNDDTINANGTLVHPDEIESKIQHIWPNLTFSVVGRPDPRKLRDTLISLCVETKDLDEEQIACVTMAHLKEAMNSDPILMPYEIIKLDQLPRTRTKKVNRAELRRILADRA